MHIFPRVLEVDEPQSPERNLPEGHSQRRRTETALNKKFALKEANEDDTTYYTSPPSALS